MVATGGCITTAEGYAKRYLGRGKVATTKGIYEAWCGEGGDDESVSSSDRWRNGGRGFF